MRSPLAYTLTVIGFGALLTTSVNLPADSLVDPTRPPNTIPAAVDESEEVEEGLMLTSILVSPGRKVAVISGVSVTEGQLVRGARVLEIQPFSVRVFADNGVRTLRLSGDPIKSSVDE